ncbi:MAG: hypothetical protein Q9160_005689 [Pyrenula sp. 1 TL-2023]
MRVSLISVISISLRVACQDPGFPFPDPTISYWQLPPNEDVADVQTPKLPTSADIVIIGSDMTGASVAWHLLQENNATNPLRIAMVEARQACSGATGRNGGHIRPSSYSEYAEAREGLPKEDAIKITRLRAAHVEAFQEAAQQLSPEGQAAAQARSVDSIDAFFNQTEYDNAVASLQTLRRDVPDIGSQWQEWDQEKAREISLLKEAVGMLTGTPRIAGALWPYRFVTHGLKLLLDKFPTFSLDTHTVALNVTFSGSPANGTYAVKTDRGTIQARHVVYATNAWTPHFVPRLQSKISGGRLHMSAQLAGSAIPNAGKWPAYLPEGSLPGGRAWSLYREGLDYVVQMPRDGVLMYGGDAGFKDENEALDPMDDSAPPNHFAVSYLNGALPNYFGYDTWGAERTDYVPEDPDSTFPGRTKRVWTGIEGGSRDGRPFVGRLSTNITQRPSPADGYGGEWVSAAYDGEGMCFAWLCGKALSAMIIGDELKEEGRNQTVLVPEWFPEAFTVPESRMEETPRSSPSIKRRMTDRIMKRAGYV